MNLYAYCLSSPVNSVDADGRRCGGHTLCMPGGNNGPDISLGGKCSLCTLACTVLHEKVHVMLEDQCCRKFQAAFQGMDGPTGLAAFKKYTAWRVANQDLWECQAYAADLACATAMRGAGAGGPGACLCPDLDEYIWESAAKVALHCTLALMKNEVPCPF